MVPNQPSPPTPYIYIFFCFYIYKRTENRVSGLQLERQRAEKLGIVEFFTNGSESTPPTPYIYY